jgi:hypothetical protein
MSGIWINTQGKGLYLCKGFDAPQLKNYALDKSKPYAIEGHVSYGMQPFLGWYATEERALEILNAIQEHIWECERSKLFPEDGYVEPIYTMPTE